jgi:hypothetical protein
MSFVSDLVMTDDRPGKWTLVEPLVWDDGERRIEVPTGFVTDLASVPRLVRGVLNVNGKSRKPAVLHDYLYRTKLLKRKDADALFAKALKAEGVNALTRAIYWSGVRIGGSFSY